MYCLWTKFFGESLSGIFHVLTRQEYHRACSFGIRVNESQTLGCVHFGLSVCTKQPVVIIPKHSLISQEEKTSCQGGDGHL